MRGKNKFRVWIFLICLAIMFSAGFIGSLFTSNTVDSDWYLENKSSFTPPNWVFGPVWSVLYFLIAIALYLTWTKSKKDDKEKVIGVFGFNLIFNVIWSVLFFGFRNPALAFIDLILIFVTIIMMIFVSGKIDKKAGWLLVPYLLWVGFAGFLNFGFL
jgi:translocator protein